MLNQIVVAGAIVRGCTVLVAQRVRPPELAGRWELPGGKVAAGETERAALARELAEELGLEVADLAVGDRVGDDIALNGTTTLRAYRVHLLGGEPRARDGDGGRTARCRLGTSRPRLDCGPGANPQRVRRRCPPSLLGNRRCG